MVAGCVVDSPRVGTLDIASLELPCLVPGAGLEPARPLGQWILNPPRLPFRHPGWRREQPIPAHGGGGEVHAEPRATDVTLPASHSAAHEGLAAWRNLGDASDLRLVAAEVLLVGLELRSPVRTAIGVHRERPIVLVRLECLSPNGESVIGWGESAALADTTYDAEDADSVQAQLSELLIPSLVAHAASSGGQLPGIKKLDVIKALGTGVLWHDAGTSVHLGAGPLAWAALEMAVGDAHLRALGMGLAELLGVGGEWVAPGAVVGTQPAAEELMHAVDSLADLGFCRVKVKIGPGSDIEPLDVLRQWAAQRVANRPGEPLPAFQVDGNGAYAPSAVGHLASFDRFDLLCVEQPFAPWDLESSARLASIIRTPICLDEGIGSLDDVVTAVEAGACSVVCVKPARLGGIGPALEVIAWCESQGVEWWMGGMFESGFARAATTALSALSSRPRPGDLAPAANYLVEDLAGEALATRKSEGGTFEVQVHQGDGVGPMPDGAIIDRTIQSQVRVPVVR